MSDQEALFGPGVGVPERKPWQGGYNLYDGTPPHEEPGTSVAAAESMRPLINRLQRQVLLEIERSGEDGRTDDELEVITGLKHQTVSARRRELYLLGRIETDGTRSTRSGRKAKVWRLRAE